jgi:hypothetical protein
MKLTLRHVEQYNPVVDILIVRLRAKRIGIAAKDTPMNVIEVLAFLTLSNFIYDAIRKVGWEVVDGPVDTVLLKVVWMGQVRLVAMSVFTTALVWGPDPPQLCSALSSLHRA